MIAAVGTAALLGGGAVGAGAAVVGDGGPAAGAAQANGMRIHEVDADVASRGRLQLEAETAASAKRVFFTYGGRTAQGRLDDADDDDRTREWSAFAPALAADRQGGHRVSVRVRACGDGGCTTVSKRPFLEREDADGDDE
jgi:hypothetical protein